MVCSSVRRQWLALLVSLNIAGVTNAGTARQESSSPPDPITKAVDLVKQFGEDLEKLDELQTALNKVRAGKVPTFGTPLGTAAQKLNTDADQLGKVDFDSGPKLGAHTPGHAIEELQLYVQQLRQMQVQLVRFRDRLALESQLIERKKVATDRLIELLNSETTRRAFVGEFGPTLDNYLVDADTLKLALNNCTGAVRQAGDHVNKRLAVTKVEISNGESNLNDPTIRQLVSNVDRSEAVLNQKTSDSIAAHQNFIQRYDPPSRENEQQGSLAAQRATHPPPPSPVHNQPASNNNVPTLPSGKCPEGTITLKDGGCARLGIRATVK
jgi:hypothetical protein